MIPYRKPGLGKRMIAVERSRGRLRDRRSLASKIWALSRKANGVGYQTSMSEGRVVVVDS